MKLLIIESYRGDATGNESLTIMRSAVFQISRVIWNMNNAYMHHEDNGNIGGARGCLIPTNNIDLCWRSNCKLSNHPYCIILQSVSFIIIVAYV